MAVPKRDSHCRIEAVSSTLEENFVQKEPFLEVLLGTRYGVSMNLIGYNI